jgi:excinuclease ABC subunit C
LKTQGSEGVIVSEIITCRTASIGSILIRPPFDDEKEVMMLAKSNATEQISTIFCKSCKKI